MQLLRSITSRVLLPLALLTIAPLARATPWERVLGGARDEQARGLAALADGGWLILGTTRTWGAGQQDAWLVCLDRVGDIRWQRSVGGSGNDTLRAGLQLPDGRIVVAGGTDSVGAGGEDAWLLALDASDGAVLWERTIGGVDDEELRDIALEPSGELWAVGRAVSTTTGDDGLLVRLDGDGDVLGATTLGSLADESLAALVVVDGRTRAVGDAATAGGSEGWLLALDEQGAPITSRTLGTSGSLLADVALAPNGDILAVGDTLVSGDAAAWIVIESPSGGIRASTVTPSRGSRFASLALDSAGRLTGCGSTCVGTAGCGVGGGADWDVFVFRAVPPWTSVSYTSLGGVSPESGVAAAIGPEDVPVVLGTTDSYGARGSNLLAVSLDPEALTTYCAINWQSSVSLTFLAVPARDFAIVVTARSWPVVAAGLAASDTDAVSDGPCPPGWCPPLTCESIVLETDPPCEDAPTTMSAMVSGGGSAVVIEWDLDEDGIVDARGTTIGATLGSGARVVSVNAHDSCTFPGIQTCQMSLAVAPVTCRVPEEVSTVPLGEPPLLVRKGASERVSFAIEPNATAYNVYSAPIGAWYSPAVSRCSDSGVTVDAPGRLGVDLSLDGSAWVLVTASNSAGEGPAGPTSAGVERTNIGAWRLCGFAR